MYESELRKNNEEFIQKIKEYDPSFFDELKKGQTPEFFVLSCSDSRVSPSVITQMPLGHMFVHRNIANQVTTEDESFSASLYYAIEKLKVKKIVIKGHTKQHPIYKLYGQNVDVMGCLFHVDSGELERIYPLK